MAVSLGIPNCALVDGFKNNQKYVTAFVSFALKNYYLQNRVKTKAELTDYLLRENKTSDQVDMICSAIDAIKCACCIKTKNRGETRLSVIKNFLPPVLVGGKYVDFGCGDASITACVAAHYKLPSCIGVDIVPFPPVRGIIPATSTREIESNSIDLVTALMSLHHCGAPSMLEIIVADISRIMRTGGRLIIREHDSAQTAEFFAFMNCIHVCAATQAGEKLERDNLICHYQTAAKWHALMARHGLTLIKYYKYPENNHQEIFTASYRKTSR